MKIIYTIDNSLFASVRKNQIRRYLMRKFKTIFVTMILAVFLLSGCFHSDKAENNEPDILTKTSWISYDDGSYWVFNKDNSFFWYQEKGVTDDNYYGGTYKLYRGEEAMDFIEKKLSSYGVTKSELIGRI